MKWHVNWDNCRRKCCMYITQSAGVMTCAQTSRLRFKPWRSQTALLNLFVAQNTVSTEISSDGMWRTLSTTPFRYYMLGRYVVQFARIYRRCERTRCLHIQSSLKVETPGSSETSAHLHRMISSGTVTFTVATGCDCNVAIYYRNFLLSQLTNSVTIFHVTWERERERETGYERLRKQTKTWTGKG
jgi:hypothetical protein